MILNNDTVCSQSLSRDYFAQQKSADLVNGSLKDGDDHRIRVLIVNSISHR
jgi:hypothetical protein